MRRIIFVVIASFLLYYCLCAALSLPEAETKKAVLKNGYPF